MHRYALSIFSGIPLLNFREMCDTTPQYIMQKLCRALLLKVTTNQNQLVNWKLKNKASKMYLLLSLFFAAVYFLNG